MTNLGYSFNRSHAIIRKYPKLSENCEVVLKGMWLIEDELGHILRKKGKQLSSQKSFVWAYFRRNILYLQSGYLLVVEGFSNPCSCLHRTVYETILRSYLFITTPKEATQYYSVLKTKKEEEFLKKRRYYGHSYLLKHLYRPESQAKLKALYKMLCQSAHAEIKGLLLDFPAFQGTTLEDRLKVTLYLSYGNIQLIAENFFVCLNDNLRNLMKSLMKEIVTSLGNLVPKLEPDKDTLSKMIKLKSGNFLNELK